jgi:hypothetical protein
MQATPPMPEGLRRARRTAATARAALAAAGGVLIVAQLLSTGRASPTPLLMLVGLAIIFVTAQVQLVLPSIDSLKVEESLAPLAAVLIVGIGPERVSAVWLLWLAAVACGVLARGGRQFWVGRALLLLSLALPIVLQQRLSIVLAGTRITTGSPERSRAPPSARAWRRSRRPRLATGRSCSSTSTSSDR